MKEKIQNFIDFIRMPVVEVDLRFAKTETNDSFYKDIVADYLMNS